MADHTPIGQAYSQAFYHYLRWWQASGIRDWGVSSVLSSAATDFEPKSDTPSQSDSLKQLEQDIHNFNGCDLKQFAMNTVFARGSDNAIVMCVGEAPGADEDREGKPFVGRSGRLLDVMLQSIGLGTQQVRIGNIVPWRPPGNRTPNPEEIEMCVPFIRRHIALVEPRILIFLGNVATAALLGRKEGISRLRGQWYDYHGDNGAIIKARPMFHPAYLLRSPLHKKLAWQDLCAITRLLETFRDK